MAILYFHHNFHIFAINFYIPMDSMTYSSSETFFTINNISRSVKRSNFTLLFLRFLAMLMLVWKENGHDQPHIFWGTVSLWTYRSWYSSQNFILKPLQTLFHSHDLHQEYLPCLDDCKNLLFQVMKFCWIFPNHPYIHLGKHLFTTIN